MVGGRDGIEKFSQEMELRVSVFIFYPNEKISISA